MKPGVAVKVIKSGHTGKVYQVSMDMVKVRMATGAHAGQIRKFRRTSLERI